MNMLGSIILKYFKPSIIASRLVRYNTISVMFILPLVKHRQQKVIYKSIHYVSRLLSVQQHHEKFLSSYFITKDNMLFVVFSPLRTSLFLIISSHDMNLVSLMANTVSNYL